MPTDPKQPPDVAREKKREKKPYSSPLLRTYGDIREIATSAGMKAGFDGALHGNTKTQ